jgi:hypothetical protein
MRFSAGHQQRRLRRDGHHSMPPSIFDPTKDLHKRCPAAQAIYEMSSFQMKTNANANANADADADADPSPLKELGMTLAAK